MTAVYIITLTVVCLVKISTPAPKLEVIGFDKIVHFCLYFGLNLLLITTMISHKGSAKLSAIISLTLSAILYGVAIEIIQGYVGRDFDLYDIAANSLGAIVASIVLLIPKVQRTIKKHLVS